MNSWSFRTFIHFAFDWCHTSFFVCNVNLYCQLMSLFASFSLDGSVLDHRQRNYAVRPLLSSHQIFAPFFSIGLKIAHSILWLWYYFSSLCLLLSGYQSAIEVQLELYSLLNKEMSMFWSVLLPNTFCDKNFFRFQYERWFRWKNPLTVGMELSNLIRKSTEKNLSNDFSCIKIVVKKLTKKKNCKTSPSVHKFFF